VGGNFENGFEYSEISPPYPGVSDIIEQPHQVWPSGAEPLSFSDDVRKREEPSGTPLD
jgi:hypothetical protein